GFAAAVEHLERNRSVTFHQTLIDRRLFVRDVLAVLERLDIVLLDERVLRELKEVAAEEADATLDVAADDGESGHHPDHRKDADGDAGHRQDGTKLVRSKGAERHADHFIETHRPALPSSALRAPSPRERGEGQLLAIVSRQRATAASRPAQASNCLPIVPRGQLLPSPRASGRLLPIVPRNNCCPSRSAREQLLRSRAARAQRLPLAPRSGERVARSAG